MRLSATALALAFLAAGAANAQTPETAPSTASTASAPAPKPETIASDAPRVYLEEAKIVVDGKAEYNGSVSFEFTPLGGVSKTFDVTVLAKTKEKDIAKDIHKELTIAAGGTYKVKLSGDTVKVSRSSSKVPNFAIVITKLNVSGVSVLVKRG